MNADTTLDALGIDIIADRSGFEQTLLTFAFTQSTGSAQVAGTTSGTGRTAYYVTVTETGAQSIVYAVNADADTAANIADDFKAAINTATGLDISVADGTNTDQLIATRMISGGAVNDLSPLAVKDVTVTPIIDAAQVSTTIGLLGDNVIDYGQRLVAATANGGGYNSTTPSAISNASALASGLFTFDVTEKALAGIRVSLKNTGSLAFASAVTLTNTAVSNTAIIPVRVVKGAASGLPNGYDNLLVGGVNAPTYANYPAIQQYVTAFSEITSGTTTTTTAAVTAVDTDRTGW